MNTAARTRFLNYLAGILFGPILSSTAFAQDALEPNDSIGTGTPQTDVVFTHAGLTIHNGSDEDFSDLLAHGDFTYELKIPLTNAAWDLDMWLMDYLGNPVSSATSTDDDEFLSLAIPSIVAYRAYRLRVFGFGGATNSYNLEVKLDTRVP